MSALVGIRDGGLTKQGAGHADAEGRSTQFTGPVRLTAGTLALVNAASNNIIAAANFIDVQFGTCLDVTGLDNGPFTGTLVLAGGQTLKGRAPSRGQLIAAGGSTVAPGAHSVGGSPGILIQDRQLHDELRLVAEHRHRRQHDQEYDIGNHGQMDVTRDGQPGRRRH